MVDISRRIPDRGALDDGGLALPTLELEDVADGEAVADVPGWRRLVSELCGVGEMEGGRGRGRGKA